MKQKQTIQLVSEKHSENISNMLNILYKEEHFADVTLCCKDGSMKAHKIVLAACSPYFKSIFTEHKKDHPLIIMPGLNLNQLENLIDLIYKGSADVTVDNLSILNSFVDELEINDILQDEYPKNTSDSDPANLGSGYSTLENNHGRDTRYKGLKRVAVDFKENDEKETVPAKIEKKMPERRPSGEKNVFKKSSIMAIAAALEIMPKNPVREDTEEEEPNFNDLLQITHEETVPNPIVKALEAAQRKAALWSKKPRKYQCELCPSSFKRASHLTRHQLVHTGERPYACNQCDKAFSRHDKLKHHIKKAHEDAYLISPEWIGHPQIDVAIEEDPPLSPSAINSSLDISIVTEEEEDLKNVITTNEVSNPNNSISHNNEANNLNTSSVSNTSSVVSNVSSTSAESPVKKGRGRPRKYPKLPPPLIKRGRGRPRIHPVNQGDHKSEQYDITNLPFGDLEYLTQPLRECISDRNAQNHSVVIEPIIQINTEINLKSEKEGQLDQKLLTKQLDERSEDLQCSPDIFTPILQIEDNNKTMTDFENQIAKIGECTISVAPASTFSHEKN